MKNSIEKIVESVLIKNRIGNYDKKDLELQLQIHPNYPSFQSITDTLDYFNIDNIAVEVPIEALDQLPACFVSLVRSENAEEIVVVTLKNNLVHLKHSSLKKKKFTFDEFKELWVPKVIAVEHSTSSKFSSNRSILQYVLLAGLLISSIIGFVGRPWDISQLAFLLLSLSGVIFSFFAVRESLGIQSQVMHQFCTSVGKTNCGDVINNSKGQLFGKFSLADAGMLFFGSISLYQLFFGFSNMLFLPVLGGIPIILYALYSQAFIIKKWCAVCLAIASISIGLTVMAILNVSLIIDIPSITSLVMVSSLFALVYIYTKGKIKEHKTSKSENIRLSQFKRDGEIFNHLLSVSDKIEGHTSIENEIVLGNPNSEFRIVSLTNPMCGYCKDAFEAYARALKSMSERVQIIIRMRVNVDQIDNQDTQIGLRLLEIYKDQGQDHFMTAYSDWFTDRTYAKWVKKYGKPANQPEHIEVLKKQSEWAEHYNLLYTPATLINNTIYPKKYGYDEFFHFMNVMAENYSEEGEIIPQSVEA